VKLFVERLVQRIDLFAYTLFALFTLAAIVVSLNRFWQYEIFYYDFGIFDRAIWLVSQFKAPVIDHLVVGGKLIFADHFSPSIFLLSPLFWLTDKSEVLLIAQSIIVGLAGLFIYKMGKMVTKNSLFSFAILVSFYFFIGIQNAVISDFHEVTIATLAIALCFYFFIKNKKIPFVVFFLLTLGFKESNFLLGAGIALSTFFLNKHWRRLSIALFIISIAWGIFTIKFAIPHFAHGPYGYDISFTTDKLNIIFDLLDTPMKRTVMFYSLLSFGFLPLVHPAFLFVIIQDFLIRFLSNRVSLGLHYSAQLACIFAISSFYGYAMLKRNAFIKKYMTIVSFLLMLNALFLYRFVLRGPLALSYNKSFYLHTNDFTFLNELIAKVPKGTRIMTQNNLASHFTHESEVWVLKDNYETYDAEYIVLDFRSGQNANDFFPTKHPNLILKKLLKDPHYEILFEDNNAYIFHLRKKEG